MGCHQPLGTQCADSIGQRHGRRRVVIYLGDLVDRIHINDGSCQRSDRDSKAAVTDQSLVGTSDCFFGCSLGFGHATGRNGGGVADGRPQLVLDVEAASTKVSEASWMDIGGSHPGYRNLDCATVLIIAFGIEATSFQRTKKCARHGSGDQSPQPVLAHYG
jgi:hypothetical protein